MKPLPPSPPAVPEGDGKRGGGRLLGELTISALLILILGWFFNQNLKLYDEISKLKDENKKLSDRVLMLEQSKFISKNELSQLTITKEGLERLTGGFASKDDLSQTDIRMKSMIYQLGVWAQDDFAEICAAGQGTFTSDNICKFNDGKQQMVFHPMNLDLKK